nr:uncharacterized protein LOC123571867 [Macaca fascicularis]
MQVPSVAAAGERGDGRTFQFLHTPPGAPENKSFADAWAEAGVRRARRRGTISTEPQAASWALPASPQAPPSSARLGLARLRSARLGSARLGSVPLHSRAPSSRPGSRALRPARAHPAPSRPLSRDSTLGGVPTELSEAEQVPRPPVRARSPRRSRPAKGEKRGRSAI